MIIITVSDVIVNAESEGSICGNGIVEDGEMCDCGRDANGGRVEVDPCCNCTSCQLPSNITCSPSQGPCCGTNCEFLDNTNMCRANTSCSTLTYCEYPLFCNS